jgi:hypothetical protein
VRERGEVQALPTLPASSRASRDRRNPNTQRHLEQNLALGESGKNSQGWQDVQLVGERPAEHQPSRLAVERHNDFHIGAMMSARAPRIVRDRAVGRPVTKIDIDHGGTFNRWRKGRYLPRPPSCLAARLKRSSRRAQRFAFPTTDAHLAAITGGAGKFCRIQATRLLHKGTLILQIVRNLATVLGELDHHLFVQPDIHCGRIFGVTSIVQLMCQLFARGKTAIQVE